MLLEDLEEPIFERCPCAYADGRSAGETNVLRHGQGLCALRALRLRFLLCCFVLLLEG